MYRLLGTLRSYVLSLSLSLDLLPCVVERELFLDELLLVSLSWRTYLFSAYESIHRCIKKIKIKKNKVQKGAKSVFMLNLLFSLLLSF